MNLAAIREFCIQHGIPPEELDQLTEPPVIRDIGKALTLSMQNDDDLGSTMVGIMIMVDELSAKTAALEQRIVQLEGGAV
ncbi:hypothetical protein [Paenibacillus sp. OV219]|uniref:hypothetical protein n=1 Tax=Paenibacillus sp. OV219 TaxID=1884377 RepID=UPI0008C2096C|nr:hypothetical protein [Paenibacillus sp. OV219]SEM82079.1 hypothetical protein SAMN05518847_101888 [Paenibacillus sp. OV219]